MPAEERTLRYFEALNSIRADILNGAFPAGARLKIAELSRRYQTSHMPVREALRLLNGEGLVDIEPNKGVRVRRYDQAFLENLFDTRIVIEEMQARRAATRRTPAQLRAIGEARLAFEAGAASESTSGLLHLNQQFHSAISEAAGNSEANEIELRHGRLLLLLWNSFGYPRSRLSVVIDDHRRIEATIRDGDADGAAILAAAHTYKAKCDMMEAFAQVADRTEAPKRTRKPKA